MSNLVHDDQLLTSLFSLLPLGSVAPILVQCFSKFEQVQIFTHTKFGKDWAR